MNGVTTSKYEGWRGTFQLYRYKTVVLVHPKGYLAGEMIHRQALSRLVKINAIDIAKFFMDKDMNCASGPEHPVGTF